MKSFCALTLQAILAGVCALAPLTAQTVGFNTGEAAHLVIGQPNFTYGDYGATANLLGSPSGIAYANGVLWVIDSNRIGATPNNNRILRYSDVSSYPSLTDQPDIPGSVCGVCRGTASLVLGQPDFNSFATGLGPNRLRNPTGIATDGNVLAIADTDNNRVLIWLHMPTANGQPADVVVGQKDFNSAAAVSPTQNSLRAPSGVWIYGGKLFVADTFDNRILIYNRIPTSNYAAADVVLGQNSFTAFVQPDLTQTNGVATSSNMQTPVSVTTDGTHLFVSDLAQNRVLIWNSIPTSNGAPADVVIGQPDMTSAATNNAVRFNSSNTDADNNPTDVTPVLCDTNGTDTVTGTKLYPQRCEKTLSFPRYAFSDGKRLFIADGGNDRVMIFNQIPTTNGAPADIILGQPDAYSDHTGDNPDGTNAFETPSGMAWDGTNLYVSDTYNRRVMVHTPGVQNIALNGVNNAASQTVHAVGTVSVSGTITADNTLTIKIGCTGGPPDCTVASATYAHTVVSSDTLTSVIQDLIDKINKSDTNATALFNSTSNEIVLTAKAPGAPGGNVTLSVTSSTNATILALASNATLNVYLQNPAQIAPGTLIQILGKNLCDSVGSADFSNTYLPTEMNNCALYVDGIRAPLLYVSPTQVNAQMPLEFSDRTSVSLYLRTQHADGTVTATTPIATTIVPQNPGIFAYPGRDPRPGIVYHASSQAFDIIDLNGIPQAGDSATIVIGPNAQSYTDGNVNVVKDTNTVVGVGTNWTQAMVGGSILISGNIYKVGAVNGPTSLTLTSNYIGVTGNGFVQTLLFGGKVYTYSETATDTISSTTDGLVAAINAGPDPYVYAIRANEYNRLIIYSYISGPAGEHIKIFGEASSTSDNTAGAQLTVSVYNPETNYDHPAGQLVTNDNPAIPGEALYTFATGIGPTNPANIPSGLIYRGGNDNPPAVFVDSILVQGLVATPMNVALVPDTAGVYYVEFALNPSLASDAFSQVTIAQQLFISNVVTIPVLIPGTTTQPPTVSSVSPATGPLAGGNTITISGTNLQQPISVTFGGVNSLNYQSINSNTITATAPAGTAAGTVSVIVTTQSGSNTANSLYTYVATPTVTSISPASGRISGGTAVTITGTALTGTTSVTFAGVAAQSFTVVNDTTITAVTPVAFQAGTAQVVVTTPGGTANTNYQYSATATSARPAQREVPRRAAPALRRR
ncbi:MAG TPA: IPT/TIG domain-containing protein [Bryobacteraceae bacterium]|nr:IPT/TIG domain-containing protein [Bryobacteraceae bacterium]